MEYKDTKIKTTYGIRIELTKELKDVWEDFIDALDIFKKETNVELWLDYWYDSKKSRRKDLSFVKDLESTIIPIKGRTFDIRMHFDAPSGVQDSKYYFVYTDSNSFISSVFEMFSFIKAILNYEEQKNENRNDRKQTFRKKTRYKKSDMEDKE